MAYYDANGVKLGDRMWGDHYYDAEGEPCGSVMEISEKEFDRYLRAHKPSDEIRALCDRVDEIQQEAGVDEEVRKAAHSRRRSSGWSDEAINRLIVG